MGKRPSQTPHLATVDALPVPLIFSIKHLLVLFRFVVQFASAKVNPKCWRQERGELVQPWDLGLKIWVWNG